MLQARPVLTVGSVERSATEQLTAVIDGLQELYRRSREPLQLRRLSQAIALLHAAVEILELPVSCRAHDG